MSITITARVKNKQGEYFTQPWILRFYETGQSDNPQQFILGKDRAAGFTFTLPLPENHYTLYAYNLKEERSVGGWVINPYDAPSIDIDFTLDEIDKPMIPEQHIPEKDYSNIERDVSLDDVYITKYDGSYMILDKVQELSINNEIELGQKTVSKDLFKRMYSTKMPTTMEISCVLGDTWKDRERITNRDACLDTLIELYTTKCVVRVSSISSIFEFAVLTALDVEMQPNNTYEASLTFTEFYPFAPRKILVEVGDDPPYQDIPHEQKTTEVPVERPPESEDETTKSRLSRLIPW